VTFVNITFSNCFQLRPPKSSKVVLPAVAPDDSRPQVRVAVAVSCNTTEVRPSSASGSPPGGNLPAKSRADAGSDVDGRRRTPVQSPSTHDDSYEATFESDSHATSAGANAGDAGINANLCHLIINYYFLCVLVDGFITY